MSNRRARLVSLALVRLVPAFALIAACGGGEPAAPARSSFEHIESQLFTASCATAGCHTGPTPAGELSLEAGRAYAQLVGVPAANANARRDGMLRVRPGVPDSSLLYHKLIAAPGHHEADYGNGMPAGGKPALSAGQLEYIKQWIADGAPRSGTTGDATLLADRTPQSAPAFEPLAPPSASEGRQLRIERFAVPPNFERELFVYRRLENATDLYVKRIRTRMRAGSHHLLLYTFKDGMPALLMPRADELRDIRLSNGALDIFKMAPMAYHVFFAGSMRQESDYTFPEGVALRVRANSGIDLNAHYVNRTGSEYPGEAYANLYTVPAASVARVVRTLNCGNTSIELPPNRRTTLEHVCRMDVPTTVFLLTAHMHKLGERFAIRVVGGPRDGELVYETRDWAHPDIRAVSTPIQLRAGEGLKAEITWNNTTSRVVRFGLTSEDEMGIIFGYAH